MNAIVKPVEQALLPLFKGLPALPENARKTLVKIWPILAMIFGVIQLFGVLALWNAGRVANDWVNLANELSIASGSGVVTPQLGFFYYAGLVVLAVSALIMLLAIKPLSERKKQGWDLLFLGALLNVAYGLVLMFDSYYGGFGNLLSTVVGSAIGFYLLFQVREYYLGTVASASPASASKSPTSTTEKTDTKV